MFSVRLQPVVVVFALLNRLSSLSLAGTLQYPSVTANLPQLPLPEHRERSLAIRGIRIPLTDLWISLAILVAIFAAYSSVVYFGFVAFDDPSYVVNNLRLRDGLASRNLSWIFLSFRPDNWFPLTRLSLILDYQTFGLAAGWYHAENVLIHAAAALLLFGFLRRATGARWCSALVAFMFALHPLHVESVAWISERKDVLCAFFWFATLWAWWRYIEKPSRGRYLGALAWFCLGLMSKPMIVTLPFLLVLLDVWPFRRAVSPNLISGIVKKLPEKIPFMILSGAVMWITMQAQQQAVLNPASPFVRVENTLISAAAYICDTFWPAHLWAAYAYPASLPVWQAAAAAIVLVAISIFALRRLSDRPWLATGWLWFIVTLAPVIGLVQVGGQARADRYMYVPMVGLSIMIVWGLAEFVAGRPSVRPWAAGLSLAACASMGVATWNQTQYWKDTDTLFQHAIQMDPGNYLAWNYLGHALLESGSFPSEAISCFRNALAIRPDIAATHNNLAVILSRQGKTEDALAEYQEALRLNPDFVVAHVNLAGALAQHGQILNAINEYEIALSLNPSDINAQISLGTLLANRGDLAEGIPHVREAVRLDPTDKTAQLLLGQMLVASPGHASEAIAHLNEALRLDPNYAKAHASLADALLQLHGHEREALAHLETAQQIDPNPKRAERIAKLKAK